MTNTFAEIDLDVYTDATAMRSVLQSQLPGFADGPLHINALAVRNARRNTSRGRNPCRMSLCYELRVSDRLRGLSGTQLLFAQVFHADGAAAAFAQQDGRRLTPPAFGDALVHLPAWQLLLWALPNDPGLPQLPTLLDPARAASVLPCRMSGDVAVELLRYEPQRRATLRYTITPPDGDESQTLYAKTFCDSRGADIHQRFAYFWQRAQADATAPLVARPLGHDAATRTLWQVPAVGVPLLEALASHDGATLMGRVARALALLHAAPLEPSPDITPRSAAHWIAEVHRRQTKIGRVDPALAERAARVAEAIEAQATPQAARPLSLIHGDFHAEQIWVHEQRVVLFDFDEFTLGDPMEDLAEFVAKLEQAGALPALASALIEQYAAAAPERFDGRSLAWHLAIQTLLQASRAFIFQRPGWAQALEQRLAASEARAAVLAEPNVLMACP
jgi:aminoglycoside phosphotransferase